MNQLRKIGSMQEVNCADELRAREWISKLFEERTTDANGPAMGIKAGTKLIRMVFHDAIDYNNLMASDGTIMPIEKTGGVDFCLHTSLLAQGHTGSESDNSPKGEPNHNRGLNGAFKVMRKTARQRALNLKHKFTYPDVE